MTQYPFYFIKRASFCYWSILQKVCRAHIIQSLVKSLTCSLKIPYLLCCSTSPPSWLCARGKCRWLSMISGYGALEIKQGKLYRKTSCLLLLLGLSKWLNRTVENAHHIRNLRPDLAVSEFMTDFLFFPFGSKDAFGRFIVTMFINFNLVYAVLMVVSSYKFKI